jgi:hypothetical protein
MCRPQAQRASLNVYRDRSDRWLASALQDFFLKAISSFSARDSCGSGTPA